jgi:hypothetical protein
VKAREQLNYRAGTESVALRGVERDEKAEGERGEREDARMCRGEWRKCR